MDLGKVIEVVTIYGVKFLVTTLYTNPESGGILIGDGTGRIVALPAHMVQYMVLEYPTLEAAEAALKGGE